VERHPARAAVRAEILGRSCGPRVIVGVRKADLEFLRRQGPRGPATAGPSAALASPRESGRRSRSGRVARRESPRNAVLQPLPGQPLEQFRQRTRWSPVEVAPALIHRAAHDRGALGRELHGEACHGARGGGGGVVVVAAGRGDADGCVRLGAGRASRTHRVLSWSFP